MALVLSLKTGEDFYVAEERFIVEEVVHEFDFKVRREATGEVFHITDAESVPVLPNVFLLAGGKPSIMMARVAIDAPSSMVILRGDKYRNPPAHIRARRQ